MANDAILTTRIIACSDGFGIALSQTLVAGAQDSETITAADLIEIR